MLNHYRTQGRQVVKTLVPGCKPQRKSVVDLLSNGLPTLPPRRRRRGLLEEQELQLPPRWAEVEPPLVWRIRGGHAPADLRAERLPAPVLRLRGVRLDSRPGPLRLKWEFTLPRHRF